MGENTRLSYGVRMELKSLDSGSKDDFFSFPLLRFLGKSALD